MTEWIKVRITDRQVEAEGIVSFALEPVAGGDLPCWQAGAHIDVRLPSGIVRQYSLCGPAEDTRSYQLGVLKEAAGRGGSEYLHSSLRQGDTLEISAPRNLFALAAQDRAILFAGGIGVTPIMAMAERLALTGAEFEVHYCTRSQTRAAFRDRLENAVGAGRISCYFDDQPGLALDAASILDRPEPGTHLYVCGPDGFMNHILDTARKAGWSPSNMHFERFSATPAQPGGDEPFTIVVEGTGQIIEVAAGQPALQALEDAGIDIPKSCEQGICGTCLTDVVEGIPDHQDMFLSDAEKAVNDCFTPCCSRALTPRLTIRI